MPRREGMERKDLLAANVKIFKEQGNALDKFAKKNVKVLVNKSIKTVELLKNVVNNNLVQNT